jgi:hypothetical protein
VDINFLGANSTPISLWRLSPQGASTSSVSRLHDHNQGDTPCTVGLLWTSDQPEAAASTWHFTTLTRERHPWPRQDSNLQTQHASKRKATSQTARPPGSFRDRKGTLFGLFHKNLHLASTSFITNGVLQREVVLRIFDVVSFTAQNLNLLIIRNIHYLLLASL